MIGKINEHGSLWVMRGGKLRKQLCPQSAVVIDECGHWCPLFGEPKREYTMDGTGRGERVILQLCKRFLVFTELTDERKEKSNDESD